MYIEDGTAIVRLSYIKNNALKNFKKSRLKELVEQEIKYDKISSKISKNELINMIVEHNNRMGLDYITVEGNWGPMKWNPDQRNQANWKILKSIGNISLFLYFWDGSDKYYYEEILEFSEKNKKNWRELYYERELKFYKDFTGKELEVKNMVCN